MKPRGYLTNRILTGVSIGIVGTIGVSITAMMTTPATLADTSPSGSWQPGFGGHVYNGGDTSWLGTVTDAEGNQYITAFRPDIYLPNQRINNNSKYAQYSIDRNEISSGYLARYRVSKTYFTETSLREKDIPKIAYYLSKHNNPTNNAEGLALYFGIIRAASVFDISMWDRKEFDPLDNVNDPLGEENYYIKRADYDEAQKLATEWAKDALEKGGPYHNKAKLSEFTNGIAQLSNVGVVSDKGAIMPGSKYVLEIMGPAQFENGSKVFRGTTGDSIASIPIQRTGLGEITIKTTMSNLPATKVFYLRGRVDNNQTTPPPRNASPLIRLGDNTNLESEVISESSRIDDPFSEDESIFSPAPNSDTADTDSNAPVITNTSDNPDEDRNIDANNSESENNHPTDSGGNSSNDSSIEVEKEDIDMDTIPNDEDTDIDGDGINNQDELAAGINPKAPDSDNNGVRDGDEDSDNDGVINKNESDPNATNITDKNQNQKADLIDPDYPTDNSNTNSSNTAGNNKDEEIDEKTSEIPTVDNNPTRDSNPNTSSKIDSDATNTDSEKDETSTTLNNTPNLSTDTDNDGILDENDTDIDNDGVNNQDELAAGINPYLSDTNGNGIPDGEEDSDADGIINMDESDPLSTSITDKNRNGVADLIDVEKASNPASKENITTGSNLNNSNSIETSINSPLSEAKIGKSLNPKKDMRVLAQTGSIDLMGYVGIIGLILFVGSILFLISIRKRR